MGDTTSPELDMLRPAMVMQAAEQEAELDDYGDMGFVEPLTRYLEALVTEAGLTSAGAAGQFISVKSALVNRLRFQRDLTDHPDIAYERVDDPIVIVGLPRTGTTKLQRLLAATPNMRSAPFWQLLNPAPFPDAVAGEPDPRIAMAELYVALIADAHPEVMAAHPMQATEADEEVFLMNMTFAVPAFSVATNAPRWWNWLWQRPPSDVYAFLRSMLQYLQWQDGGRQDRRWVLKSPMHIGALDHLVKTFPHATVVFCHRDLSAVVPSAIRLGQLWQEMSSGEADPLACADAFMRFYPDAMERMLEQRRHVPDGVSIVDIDFDRICDAPIEAVRQIFEAAGEALTPQAEQSMLAWERDNPRDRFGKHAYSMEQYGLTEESIRERFPTYSKDFHV